MLVSVTIICLSRGKLTTLALIYSCPLQVDVSVARRSVDCNQKVPCNNRPGSAHEMTLHL